MREPTEVLFSDARSFDLSVISPEVCWSIKVAPEILSTNPTSYAIFPDLGTYMKSDHIIGVFEKYLDFCGNEHGKLRLRTRTQQDTISWRRFPARWSHEYSEEFSLLVRMVEAVIKMKTGFEVFKAQLEFPFVARWHCTL
jgi:hypothetical protein